MTWSHSAPRWGGLGEVYALMCACVCVPTLHSGQGCQVLYLCVCVCVCVRARICVCAELLGANADSACTGLRSLDWYPANGRV